MWGCKFDANAKEIACGVAMLDENDELVIVSASVRRRR
jgi:hypothetical protein